MLGLTNTYKNITKVSLLENDVPYALKSDTEAQIKNGVYAVTANGLLIDYTTADSTCVAIAFISDNLRVMIAKNDATDGTNTTFYWGYNLKGNDVPNLVNCSDSVTAEADYNGKANTAVIIAGYTALGKKMNNRDMCKVLETYNEGGYTDWYVPSYGLLLEFNLNLNSIQTALATIGGTSFVGSKAYWSSSELSNDNAWFLSFNPRYIPLDYDKNTDNTIRFVRDLPPYPLKEKVVDIENRLNDSNYILDDVVSDGVYAVDANGELIDYNIADTTATGVALVAGEHKFMIAKSDATNDGSNYNLYYDYDKGDLSLTNYSNADGTNSNGNLGTKLSDDFTTWTAGALSDFNGKSNTQVIAASSSNAKDMCKVLETFNAGSDNQGHSDWYVPAAGQLALMYLAKTDINAALANIGGTAFESYGYWSSSESDANKAWFVHFGGGLVNNSNKYGNYRVRFVRDISTPKLLKERVLDLESSISNVYSMKEIDSMLSISKYEFVDLGLPSGLRWATTNIGAENPEDCGLYFSWGETKGYEGPDESKEFSWEDYKWGNSTSSISKYNTSDNLTVLESVDDASFVSDNTSKTPTPADLQELIANTTSTWETLNGVNGRRFTSKTNGNSIFIPASGCYRDGEKFNYNNLSLIWTSAVNKNSPIYGYGLNSSSVSTTIDISNRYLGIPIRPIQDPNVNSKFKPLEIYNRLDNLEKEDIPTKLSQLENDKNYIENGDGYNSGVYIAVQSGKLINPDEYDSTTETAVGVAVIDPKANFIIGLNHTANIPWGTSAQGLNTDISGLTNYTSVETAATDMDGIANTEVITAIYSGTDCAAGLAKSQTITYGDLTLTGYLGSAGEWIILLKYSNQVSSAMDKAGGNVFQTTNVYYHTSTEYNSSTNVRVDYRGENPATKLNLSGSKSTKSTMFYTVPFYEIDNETTLLSKILSDINLISTPAGSSTAPIYIDSNGNIASTIYGGGTKVTLNGSAKGGSTASFYAPTSAGTSGYILTSNGSGAPSWLSPGKKIASTSGSNVVSLSKTMHTVITDFTSGKLYYAQSTTQLEEYSFEFVCPENFPGITIYPSTSWINIPETFTAGKTYIGSILGNTGIILECETALDYGDSSSVSWSMSASLPVASGTSVRQTVNILLDTRVMPQTNTAITNCVKIYNSILGTTYYTPSLNKGIIDTFSTTVTLQRTFSDADVVSFLRPNPAKYNFLSLTIGSTLVIFLLNTPLSFSKTKSGGGGYTLYIGTLKSSS